MLDLFTIGMSLSLASFLQGIAGFGFSLVALPLILSLNGGSPVEAITITIINSTLQRLMSMKKLGGHVDWKELYPVFPFGLFGLVIGIGLLYVLSNVDKSVFKQAVGILILSILFIKWFLKVKPTDTFKRGWGMFAAGISGVLTGFANIGGPPIVMWALSHNWRQEKMRITVIAFTICFVPLQLLLLWIAFGNTMLPMFLKSLIYFPFVLLGTWLGLLIGNRMNVVATRTVMYVILMIICLALIIQPLI
ncbi:sulfite exporter TauE/SafE family protein [Planctomycetota bacterium]